MIANQALIFSHLCPYFSPRDSEEFNKFEKWITFESLLDLGFTTAAFWFQKHQNHWNKFHEKSFTWIEQSAKYGFETVGWGSQHYPKSLEKLSHPPAFLFFSGDLKCLDQTSAAIVGAREPTYLGRQWVQKEILELIASGLTIVSGGARGIDSEAHEGAVREKNGRTAAFLPGGPERLYPRSNLWLFEKIRKQGCLVTEFPPGTDVRAENFHRRNRLIAGASDVVIIVEASEKSGTIMTANRALSENIDVLVVPGSPLLPSYVGSLLLLTTGAGLARNAKDVLETIAQKKSLKKNH